MRETARCASPTRPALSAELRGQRDRARELVPLLQRRDFDRAGAHADTGPKRVAAAHHANIGSLPTESLFFNAKPLSCATSFMGRQRDNA